MGQVVSRRALLRSALRFHHLAVRQDHSKAQHVLLHGTVPADGANEESNGPTDKCLTRSNSRLRVVIIVKLVSQKSTSTEGQHGRSLLHFLTERRLNQSSCKRTSLRGMRRVRDRAGTRGLAPSGSRSAPRSLTPTTQQRATEEVSQVKQRNAAECMRSRSNTRP